MIGGEFSIHFFSPPFFPSRPLLYWTNSFRTSFRNFVFVLNSTSQKIIQVQRRFFWAGSGNGKGLPLVAWEGIQRPKHLGGLGVSDLVIKNAAPLF